MGGLLNLWKFKTYNPSRIYKIILNQMWPLLRHNHYTHLFSKGQVCNVPLRYGFVIENDNTSHIIENDDPTTYSKAFMSSDSDKWLNAMKFEIDSMYANQVWILVNALEDVTLIDCKWIFKKKIGADDQVETYKAKLVAKDFRQK